jgi:hypothetical protein
MMIIVYIKWNISDDIVTFKAKIKTNKKKK